MSRADERNAIALARTALWATNLQLQRLKRVKNSLEGWHIDQGWVKLEKALLKRGLKTVNVCPC